MRNIFTLILLIALPIVSTGQELLSLEECIEIGLKQNFSIKIQKNEQKISNNNATIGNAGYLPTVGASTSFGGNAGGGTHNEAADIGVNLNWTLFDGLGIYAEYARLNELKAMGELNTLLAIQDLIVSISSEYYNNIRQKIKLKNLRSSLTLSKERIRIVEERYNIGSLSKLDLQQANVDFNVDSSKVIHQLEAVYTSRIMLNRLMALEPIEKDISLRDSSIIINPFLEKEAIWNKSMTSNISLLIAQKYQTISETEYKKIKSRRLPYLRVNAGYGYNASWYSENNLGMQDKMAANYGLTLGINIFDGLNMSRDQRNAKINIENRVLMIEDIKLDLKSDLSNVWMAYINYMDLLSLENENLIVAQEYYSIAIDRYKLGDLSGIELREAQLSLLDAEERCSIAEFSIKLSEILLYQLSGGVM